MGAWGEKRLYRHRFVVSVYDEIEATVQEVTPLVHDMSEPEDRMHVYAKITGLCVKATPRTRPPARQRPGPGAGSRPAPSYGYPG